MDLREQGLTSQKRPMQTPGASSIINSEKVGEREIPATMKNSGARTWTSAYITEKMKQHIRVILSWTYQCKLHKQAAESQKKRKYNKLHNVQYEDYG